MDDNLNIHMEDYLTHPYIVEKQNFKREDLIRIIGYSQKYSYDSINHLIKNNYRPKRRIIVFRDVPKEEQTQESIKNYFSEGEHNKKIIKIENSHEIYFVYFENEETAIEAFKELEKSREKNV